MRWAKVLFLVRYFSYLGDLILTLCVPYLLVITFSRQQISLLLIVLQLFDVE